MEEEQLNYYAFLLRLRRFRDEEGPVWRPSLENPHTGERCAFGNLQELFAYLEAVTLDQEISRTVTPEPTD